MITGFGRTGEPFAAQRFGVTPDMITVAKGLTSGTVPCGAVLINESIYHSIMDAHKNSPPETIELFHGYTYSGHPLAMAAGLAILDVYKREDLLHRARKFEKVWEDALHEFSKMPGVIDVRNFGLLGAIELEPIPNAPGRLECHLFFQKRDEEM